MAKKNRKIRFDQFEKQLEEVGITDLQEVTLSQDESVFMLLGVGVDVEKINGLRDRVESAETSEEAAIAILDYHPDLSGEEQFEILTRHGKTADKLIALWSAATADMRDEMGKLRPKKS